MSRPRYGEGTIRQRADGRWECAFQDPRYNDGKRKSIYGKTEQEVKKKLKELKRKIETSTISGNSKVTFETYFSHWMVNRNKKELKPASYDRLETTFRHHIAPEIGKKQLVNLNPDDIQQLIDRKADTGLSHSSVKKIYDAINACLKYAVIRRDIPFNPAEAVTLGRDPGDMGKVKYYTEEEAKQIIAQATAKNGAGSLIFRLGYAIPLLLNTGLRAGELLALRWDEDVDLTKRIIYIRHNMVMVKNRDPDSDKKYVLLDQNSTKTQRGERSLYLNDVAYNALLELKKVTGNSKYVMSSIRYKPINATNLDRMFKAICVRCGFPEDKIYGVHALRHTFASRLLQKGVDIKVISDALGHADTKITYNTYIHLSEDQRRKAVEIINEI